MKGSTQFPACLNAKGYRLQITTQSSNIIVSLKQASQTWLSQTGMHLLVRMTFTRTCHAVLAELTTQPLAFLRASSYGSMPRMAARMKRSLLLPSTQLQPQPSFMELLNYHNDEKVSGTVLRRIWTSEIFE